MAGYLPVKDGTCLRYTLLLPSVKGRFPTVLVYDTYSAGSGPLPGSPMIGSHPDAFLAAGYAVLGVNVRGTGCSQGTWDPFATEGRDGRDVVEWIAHQPWSDGRVGEIGVSDSSINALLVAEQRPPHLQAITVIATEADLYRGVAYPGGIYNHGMTTWWSLAQWQLSLIGAQAGVQEGDTACQATLVQRQHDLPLRPYLLTVNNPFDVGLLAERSPAAHLSEIALPVLMQEFGQDQQLGSYATEALSQLHVPHWLVLSNGDHDGQVVAGPFGQFQAQLALHFMDRFVRGQKNGFEQGPKVWLGWEVGTSQIGQMTTLHHALADAGRILSLALSERGSLVRGERGSGGPDTYTWQTTQCSPSGVTSATTYA